jgi:hypothetical protein
MASYPVGTAPDRNWRPPAFDLGPHQAPGGMIEYQGIAFGGALRGKLLVARYSGGDDVMAMAVGPDGRITGAQTNIPGATGLNNPLDLVEHRPTGNLYVVEFGGKRITLLRPAQVAFTPDARTPGEARLARGIENLAKKAQISAPNLTWIPTGELKTVYEEMRVEARKAGYIHKVVPLAEKRGYKLPADVYALSIDELKQLKSQAREFRAPR